MFLQHALTDLSTLLPRGPAVLITEVNWEGELQGCPCSLAATGGFQPTCPGESSSRRNPRRATARASVAAPAVPLPGLCSPLGLSISHADPGTLCWRLPKQADLSAGAVTSSIIQDKPLLSFATFLPEQRSSQTTTTKKPKPKAQRCNHLFCHDGNACACKYEMCSIYSLLLGCGPPCS